MSELKTKINDASVHDFLSSVKDERKREDSLKVLDLMQRVTGEEPKMWGKSIVGFGTYHYKYKSGKEGDWMRVAFSPRKTSLTLYVMSGTDSVQKELKRLGPHSTGVSCLYLKNLDNIDMKVLEKIVKHSYENTIDSIYDPNN